MAFGADLHVFPGGRVDPGDTDDRAVRRSVVTAGEAFERLGRDVPAQVALGAHLAAIRELFEEAGVLLADAPDGVLPGPAHRARLLADEVSLADLGDEFGLRFRTDLLAPVGRWTTPPIMARRFDTHFFAAELPAGAEPTFDTREVAAHRWLTARGALDAMADGSISMWIPTSATLQRLEHVRDLDEVRARLAPGPAAAPRVIGELPGLVRVVLTSAGSVPGQTVNAYLVGRRDVVVVDPGDQSDAAADAILGAVDVAGGRVVAIALTHVDPDHAGGAEGLAIRLDVPILAGPGSGRDVPFDVRELADGARLPGDGGLTAIRTPGPRRDHVSFGLEVGGLIAGDLVGGRGSRSVLGPPDEAAWQASLDRIAALRPRTLFPGHGPPITSRRE
jgi:glyoxylase-like metal-dependent hydrolase (beta-lactamase superfamily II)/8-oxo-dGTP pyrophosphatase MutT (NUDIX family)